jgi:3-hydroxy-9,10-secoandrosta-1,3,5(10)-triene-9,17-dione monooxygenase reductase component
VTIHTSDPFATPDEEKSPVRRLRARLPAAVTLWTAHGRDGRPAGLTVSSAMIVDGEPGHVLGLLDAESSLFEAVRESGRFALISLRESDSRVADTFAGIMPAPGGPFVGRTWHQTEWGPVLDGAAAWAGCRLGDARPLGFGQLVQATVERVEVGADDEIPLIYHRGRYVRRLSA